MTKHATATKTRAPKAAPPKRRFARQPEGETAAPSGSDTPPAEAPSAPARPSPAPQPKRTSKSDTVLALLAREQGATLDEMIEATGWLPHSTRAALTGLKKKGHSIERRKRDDVTCYFLVGAA